MFTQAEVPEVVKLTDGFLDVVRQQNTIGHILKTETAPAVASEYGRLASEFHDLGGRIRIFWNKFASIYERFPANRTATRDEELALAQEQYNGLLSALDRVIANIDGGGLNFTSEELARARTKLAGFDWSLPYADPLPASYPRIIGPHGDYDKAVALLQHAFEYVTLIMLRLQDWLNNPNVAWDAAAFSKAALLFENVSLSQNRLHRMRALDVFAPMPEDLAKITHDFQFASGLRPIEFFYLLRAMEIGFTRTSAPIFSGRSLETGAVLGFFGVTTYLAELHAALIDINTIEVVREISPGQGFFLANDNIGDAWSALDDYASSANMFFYVIPAPPGTAPELVAGPGTFIDDIPMPAVVRPRLGPNTAIDENGEFVISTADTAFQLGPNTELDASTTPPTVNANCPPAPNIPITLPGEGRSRTFMCIETTGS